MIKHYKELIEKKEKDINVQRRINRRLVVQLNRALFENRMLNKKLKEQNK